MPSNHVRSALAATAMLTLALVASGAAPAQKDGSAGKSNEIVILSTTDVKGKTSPCGCHTPKGGLSRQASFADSVRAEHGAVMVVDGGGYFPEADVNQPVVPFLMGEMKGLNIRAVGMSEKELRFGLAYFRAALKHSGLQAVCANLVESPSGRLVLPAYVIERVGNARVGVFGIMSDKVDLGIAKDSLKVLDPEQAARKTIAEMRAKGATVVVLLSQVGKVETEDLVTAVDGVDAAIAGHGVPLIEKGRMIKNSVTVYGGEQGQYMGVTTLHLDAGGHATSGDNDMVMLSPEVGERAEVLKRVKAYEDAFNESMRKREETRQAANDAENPEKPSEHYLGSEMCVRCHSKEGVQWKSTPHAAAWQSLVDVKKDATPDCIPCHSVGFQQPGGFVSASATPKLMNVQCENCHGIGTRHDQIASAHVQVTETTCRTCHTSTTSPTFDFAVYAPHVIHDYHGALPPIPESPAKKMMKGHGH